jgi:structural maintenance of chromosomes protein 5
LSRGIEEVSEKSVAATNLKEIILENFMSYEYARIPLRDGLNLIVGPNGAGKSSILLAISVALGQTYTERSRKLSDLIRRGKEIARVSLIFDNRPIGGRRPIPYSKSDTFMLSRYLRKDGSYWFEADYREIDKSEVVRLLREFGMNPDNLLIIMHQGMIEELGAVSRQQRLKMVEEAVGFQEYRERILRAEAELKGLTSEETSLAQLIDNANQALEYWKQIYDRYLEKKRLSEHRGLLEKELLWSTEAKLSKSLQSVEDRLTGKKKNLDDLRDQQRGVKEDFEKENEVMLNRQVELRKLYYSLVRAERERSKDEATRDLAKRTQGELEGLLKSVDEILSDSGQKGVRRPRELVEYLIDKGRREEEEAGRRKATLDTEVSSLQPEISRVEEGVKQSMEAYISLRVKFEVLSYRIKVTESDIRELERSAKEYRDEIEALRPELEKAGERIETQRQPYEVSEEMKLVSAHLQKMQDVPEEAEKIYNDYTGNIEELRVKLQKLQENRKVLMVELTERKKVWREAIARLLETVNPDYQSILASTDATGFIKLEEGGDIEEAGLELYVGFRGTAPTTLDPFTQSGGERSVALVAFILSLQKRIVSPMRAMDEFDIHMDPKNREAMFRMILSHIRGKQGSQYLVITPSILTVFDKTAHVITVQAVHGATEVRELKRE